MADKRMTNQRIKILSYLRSVKSHPTAEVIYHAVKKDLPAISLATVYRNLNRLADEGRIIRLEVNGEFRFDGAVCNHQHCVCKGCGQMTDCFHEEISTYAMDNMKSKGFDASCVNIIFYGTCAKCRT
ncbi:MAG: Fur family transcriptional regulator [Candidatus Woesearchaeota archaeon]